MRKIYSLVLMAAALLIGTSAWADTYVAHVDNFKTPAKSGDYTTLKQAFDDGVGYGDSATITLLTSVLVDEVILMNGGIENSNPGKIITLDLGNQNYSITGTNSNKCVFVLAKGKLDITGTGLITFQTQEETDADYYTNHTAFDNKVKPWMERNQGVCVAVMGSIDSTETNWSRLIIGENVTLTAAYAAVQLQATSSKDNALYGFSGNKYWTAWPQSDSTSVYTIDASKNVTLNTISQVCDDGATLIQSGNGFIKKRPGNATLGFGYGINIDIYGHLVGKLYGLQIKGTITATPNIPLNNPSRNFPRINVRPGSTIEANSANTPDFPRENNKKTEINTERKQPTAIYASGYAIWDIQGNVTGANGVYVKMGQIVVQGDANISSNATDTTAAHHTSSGVSGAGNAITLQSDWEDGTMGITIKADENGGTPEISSSANGGAAIVETNTTTNLEQQVQNITIEAGDFSGDVNGCVVISDNFDGDISVSGGTYTGSIETLIDAMKDDSTNVIQTVVAQNGNSATVVIGQKKEGDDLVNTNTEAAIDNFAFVADMSNDIVKLDAQVKPISKDLGNNTHVTVKYLSLTGKNADTLSVVTVGENKTLEVGQIVMNAYGKIVVEAGGKLVVTGSNGIFASKNENLVLKAEEGKSAIFLLSTAVETNISPNATVEFVSESYKKVSPVTEYRYQFFCPPMKGGIVESISAKASDNNTTYKSQLDVWRNGAWDRIGIMNSGTPLDMSKFNIPFGFYSIVSNNPPEAKMTYTLQGSLVGNTAPELPLYAGWTAISNAFTGDINAVVLWNYMLARKQAGSNIEASVYTYTIEGNTMVWNASNPLAWATQEIEPMNAFMFKNNGATEQIALSYGDLVWTPATSAAPARLMKFSNLTRVMMHVKGENGVLDRLTIAQSSDFTEERDIYDAEQYINEDINFYVTDDEKYTIFATDNLNNTYLGFSCVNGGNFTLTFDNVEGEELYLLDLNNNAVVAMVNGDSYQFTATAGETNDYRFKVIGRQEMPTEVEIVEENTIQRVGIYTLTGQYLGEMNVWNSLPAGLYIVNGEKKIK